MSRKFRISIVIKLAVVLSFLSFLGFTYYAHLQEIKIATLQYYENANSKKNHISILKSKNFSTKIQAIEKEIRNLKQGLHELHQWHKPLNATKKYIISMEERNTSIINSNVHIFYYPWYKSKNFDGQYAHWNHKVLPHWNDKVQKVLSQHNPPDDIGSNFYPKLGPYSSSDPKILQIHMKQIKYTGAGVVGVSWYPPNLRLDNEEPVDNLMMKILDAANSYGLKINFHIEPFKNRSGEQLFLVVKYIIDTYGSHPAFYRTEYKGKFLPVYYLYDSYQISPLEWGKALLQQGPYSVRNTKYDGIFIGLLARQDHLKHLSASGFDGCYTYFAIDGFEYGSTWRNWPTISNNAKNLGLIFVPSIGPGYVDTRIRPWNDKNTKKRLKGQYYRQSFLAALSISPQFLSITSFNEWHEGTQIEPAVPKMFQDYKYEDYQPGTADFYLTLTRSFIKEFTSSLKHV